MNNTNASNGTKFELPELITSLLYASAVSAMLSLSMSIEHIKITFTSIINTILVIFLVFADWNNRILVPLHFPTKDLEEQRKPLFQYTKLVSEIVSMVFLVMFFSYLVKENYCTDKTINIYLLFALYLIACGVWNLLMIRIMQGINIRPLVKSIIKGSVFDIPDLNQYTKNFIENIDKKEKELHQKYKQNVGKTKSETIRNFKKYDKETKHLLIKINLAKTLAQFIGNHIFWINFWISIMLIVITFDLTKYFSFTEIHIDSLQLPISFVSIKVILLFILILTLFVFIIFIELNSVFRKTFYGLTMFVFLLTFYSCFSIDGLIYVMLIQQIFIGLLIERITDKKISIKGNIK